MVFPANAVFAVYRYLLFLQHDHPKEFNRNYALVVNTRISGQPRYDRCLMDYL